MQWNILNGEHCHPTYPSLLFKWHKIELQPSQISQCDKTLECRNVTKTFLYVTLWHILPCTSQCHINFNECHNVTLAFIHVIMWHQLWWKMVNDGQLQCTSQCDINFDECHNVSTMLLHSEPWSSTVNHGQSWSTIVTGQQ